MSLVKDDEHKPFLERGGKSKEDVEFDEFVEEIRQTKNQEEEKKEAAERDEGEPERMRLKPEEEESGEENEDDGEEEEKPKNPHWDRLEKLQKAKESTGDSSRLAAIEQQIQKLTEAISNQNSGGNSGDNTETAAKFKFRDMEEGEDTAEYIEEREKELQKFVKEQVAKKREGGGKEAKKEEQPQTNSATEEELKILQSNFKDEDDFLDVLDARRITEGMLPHINESEDPEAVARAIANDGKLSRKIQRLGSAREIRMAIRAVEHDVVNGVSSTPASKGKPKDESNKEIPDTRPAKKGKGRKKGDDEDSLASQFGEIASRGVNYNSRTIEM